MAAERFIPELWDDRILENWNDKHVYVSCCNREYEGQISKKGDSVKIHSVNRPTVVPYNKLSDPSPTTITYESPDDSETFLRIEKSELIAVGIDDIDEKQASPNWFDEFCQEGGWALADSADVYVAELMRDNAELQTHVTYNSSTDWNIGDGPTDDDFYSSVVVKSKVMLDENNVPEDGRFMVITPAVLGVALLDPRFVSFGTAANRETLKNGSLGKVLGFDFKLSNNVPSTDSTTDISIIAGHAKATAFADQLMKSENVRLIDNVADGYRKLHLYGARVIRPYALVRSLVNIA